MPLSEGVTVLGIALGLGLLVGLERERADSILAGFRTFPLVTVLGTLCAILARDFGGWVVAAGFAGVAAAAVIGNVAKLRAGRADPGQTTEVALLVMFALGAYLVVGELRVAVALGGAVVVLLHMKQTLHGFADRIGERDFAAIARFVLISLVILPVLPNRPFGPYQVLNPFQIWLMVVLIVGINLAGYLAFRLWGERRGALMGGLLGGLVSSTATTAGYSRRSRTDPELAPAAAVVITVAAGVVYARILAEVAVVAPRFFPVAAGPLAAMLAILGLLAVLLWRRGSPTDGEAPEPGNPSELRPALLFGLLYAGVLLAAAWARQRYGAGGLYGVALISGLTDVDAITLSTAQLVEGGRVSAERGWRVILAASLSNLAFKAGIVAALGGRALFARIAAVFGAAAAAGMLLLTFWPG
jgi:uncharacterized membrane protein (DUF4010 family)